MRSTAVFVALVAFALVNTAFLGFYLTQSNATTSTSTTTNTISAASSLLSALSATQSGLTAASSSAQQASATASTASQVNTGTETSTTVGASTSTGAQSSTATEPSATSGSSTTVPTSGTVTTTTGSSTAQTTQQGTNGLTSGSSQSTSHVNGGAATSSTTTFQSSETHTAIPVTGSTSFVAALVAFFEDHSLILAPGSWFAVGGMWIWRGRMRSKWTELGFDSDVFTLFVKMKGAKTRIRLLDALKEPKDRLQLAEELGLDWKSVDRHVAVMKKYGFVKDPVAYGRVKMYQLTPMGVSLLRLLQELGGEEKQEGTAAAVPLEREA